MWLDYHQAFIKPSPSILPPADHFDYDATLMACAQGDRQALQRLYQREARYLLGVALRIVRQHHRAEDVLHDAFVNIWQRAGSFDPTRGEGRGWIYSVVRNAALNMVRSTAREATVDDDAREAIDDDAALAAYASAGDPFELRADLGRLHTCLAGLEPARRDCILYAYVEGCSHAEIAERTRTPLGTVKAWIQRGMKALRECMT